MVLAPVDGESAERPEKQARERLLEERCLRQRTGGPASRTEDEQRIEQAIGVIRRHKHRALWQLRSRPLDTHEDTGGPSHDPRHDSRERPHFGHA